MKKIVWISPHLPYSKVKHAGGKTQYYYLNRLIELNKYNVRLISFYWPKELQEFDLDGSIQSNLICYFDSGVKKILRNLLDLSYMYNPFNRYGNSTSLFLKINILHCLKRYKKEGYIPNLIILQWTQVVLFARDIKRIFPDSKIIAIEEDVLFLSYKRRIQFDKNWMFRFLSRIRYKNVLKAEKNALRISDYIIVNNQKDEKLLNDVGVKKNIKLWSAYYENFQDVERDKIPNNDIVFYGAMNRPENYNTALWIINKVKPLVKNKDIRFVMLGGNPPQQLIDLASENVIITGFVENIAPYFEHSLCIIAPLILGAGVKVKILEALSAGIPVLTNDIGIEGIPAENGVDYYHCTTPEEYANKIKYLYNNKDKCSLLSENGRKVIKDNFNYEKTFWDFIDWINKLLNI